ncbi:MAG TPA: branched-chain amino acid ABC transporter substrate-binding protein [Burkholderiales bacterium]|nr:branched-chain amino acid ABC transporter substrate-binding protein [Burkholderiales bacterium]
MAAVRVGSILILACAIAGLAACGDDKKAAGAKGGATVTIGIAAPLTGPQSHIGKDLENAVRLAAEDANAAKVVVGGKPVHFEVQAEDDQADPKMAPVVAQKLADARVAAVVGHFNSGTTIPASRIYNDAGIPQISPSATNPKYTEQGFKTAFRVVANDNQQGKVVGEYIARELKSKALAIIDDRTAYGQGVADVVERSAKAAGANVVAREFTTDRSTDFKAILTKIKGTRPDVIFFGGIDTQAGPMLQQMRGLGIEAQFVGADGIQSTELFKLGGNAVEGTLASFPGLPLERMPQDASFGERYRKKWNQDVVLYAPQGYDAFNVFVEAMKRAGSTDPAKFLPEVAKTDYNGITGPIRFDEKGDLKDGPITIFKAVGGKWQALATIGGPSQGQGAKAAEKN